MKPSAILRAALEWLGPNGERWARRELYLDINKRPTARERAQYACSVGAIHINGHYDWGDAEDYLNQVTGRTIGLWNDSAQDFSEIREGFQKAIHLAESEGR